MSEPIKLSGMVLSAASSGEYDRRTVILTKERGKITAFARGARKPHSNLLAATNPFAMGSFVLYEGKSAYTLVQAEISNYFMEIRDDFVAACYGCYFMEVADYYTRENLDAAAMLNLLYVTLRALNNKHLDRELVRCIFEMRAMVQNGEYPYDLVYDGRLKEATRYTIDYILHTPLQKLYTFSLKDEVFQEFRKVQDNLNERMLDRKFKSLEILSDMLSVL